MPEQIRIIQSLLQQHINTKVLSVVGQEESEDNNLSVEQETEIKKQIQNLDKLLVSYEKVKPKLKEAFKKKIVKHFDLSKQNNKSSFISFKNCLFKNDQVLYTF